MIALAQFEILRRVGRHGAFAGTFALQAAIHVQEGLVAVADHGHVLPLVRFQRDAPGTLPLTAIAKTEAVGIQVLAVLLQADADERLP